MQRIIIAPVLITCASALHAAEWNGEGDLGFSQVSGNSESETLTAALKLGYDTEAKWKHLLELNAFNSSQDGERSAESYGLTFNSDYAVSENTYAFGNLRYVTDKFSGYDSQTALTAGIGRNFIDDGVTLFTGKLGAGYRMSDLNTGESEDEAIGTAEVTYNRVLTPTTNFESQVLTEAGSENTYVEGSAAVKVSMTDSLALRVAYTAKHNTEVPEGTEKTDHFTSVSVNYTF